MKDYAFPNRLLQSTRKRSVEIIMHNELTIAIALFSHSTVMLVVKELQRVLALGGVNAFEEVRDPMSKGVNKCIDTLAKAIKKSSTNVPIKC